MGIALAPPEPTPVPTLDAAKAAAPASFQPWQAAMLVLAVLLGGSALFIRWRVDRAFKKNTGNQR
jgi:hypothetical protein